MNIYEVKEDALLFAKVRPDAIIPSKEDENAGYDIYANFKEDFIVIPSFTTKLIPTGIASAINKKYYAQLEERGSTGSKGIKRSCGVIDSGYRSEWFVALTNTNNLDIVISKLTLDELASKHGTIDEENDVYLKATDCKDRTYIKFSDCSDENAIVYPYSKAIAQAIIHEVPQMNVSEIDYEVLKEIPSKRGTGSLGSSNK